MTLSRARAASGITPRLLSAEQAAAYVGLGRQAFVNEVEAGTFPRAVPLRRTRRALWDRLALDAALDARLTVAVDGATEAGWHDREQAWLARRGRADQDRPARARRRDDPGIPLRP